MAIVDSQLVMDMPKELTAYSGFDALTHAIEAYVSVYATDFTFGMSLEAIQKTFEYLPRAYANGHNDPKAREHMHMASSIAGIAFANAFLGISHSLAHKLGSEFHVAHGLANACFLSHSISYNATDAPFKMACFPQYEYPHSKKRYAEIANILNLQGETQDDKITSLIQAIEDLKVKLDIPDSIEKILGKEAKEKYFNTIPKMAEMAFDDQCTGANPRYPLVSDLEKLYEAAWYGPPQRITLQKAKYAKSNE
jgi:acetaldehyde dehydrogenase/alcohol dehydrogenase